MEYTRLPTAEPVNDVSKDTINNKETTSDCDSDCSDPCHIEARYELDGDDTTPKPTCECNSVENCCYSCFTWLSYFCPCFDSLWISCYECAARMCE